MLGGNVVSTIVINVENGAMPNVAFHADCSNVTAWNV